MLTKSTKVEKNPTKNNNKAQKKNKTKKTHTTQPWQRNAFVLVNTLSRANF